VLVFVRELQRVIVYADFYFQTMVMAAGHSKSSWRVSLRISRANVIPATLSPGMERPNRLVDLGVEGVYRPKTERDRISIGSEQGKAVFAIAIRGRDCRLNGRIRKTMADQG